MSDRIPDILKTLAIQWDIWLGRYTPFYASEQSDIDECMLILEEVRAHELNRTNGENVIDSNAFAKTEVAYKLVACRDNHAKKIVGCMRVTPAVELANIDESFKEYHLDVFENDLLECIAIFTRLAVLKRHRNTPVALVVMAFAFVDFLKNGGQAILMSCEPNLFPMYKRLGLRPLGALHNSSYGGYRLPMICLPDYNHFKAVGSPALPLMKEIEWTKYKDISNWYSMKIGSFDKIETGIKLYDSHDSEKEQHWAITKGLSEKGIKQFLKNAIILNCNSGDLLMADDDGGKNFGIILDGFVKIEIEGQMISVLSKGEIFGEIAFILDRHRTANVIAGSSDTQVLMCSKSLLSRMSLPESMVIWRNLAKIMAHRIVAANKTFLGQ